MTMGSLAVWILSEPQFPISEKRQILPHFPPQYGILRTGTNNLTLTTNIRHPLGLGTLAGVALGLS